MLGNVAFLNGIEVMRFNAPEVNAVDSQATQVQSNSVGFIPFPFDISDHRDLLIAGENVFAVQLLNLTEGNQDAYILPELYYSCITTPLNRTDSCILVIWRFWR
jgi:hypothetical protein